jgi:hypothetical protein
MCRKQGLLTITFRLPRQQIGVLETDLERQLGEVLVRRA